jgi:Kef-type K+ transport system membrane component KefB
MQNQHLFILVLIATSAILLFTQFFGRLFVWLKQPFVIGEIFAGILLGPTFFGYFFPILSGALFSAEIKPFLFVLGNFGICIYMFTVGLEIDFKTKGGKMMRHAIILAAGQDIC